MRPLITIIIPAYNESRNFKKGALNKVVTYLKGVKYSYEVLIVDDGSSDDSISKINTFCQVNKNFFLIKRPHLGKAAAIYAGVKEAKGELILFTDFDQATPLREIEKLLPFIKRGYDVVIGSREVEGSRREKEPFYRHLMGRVFNLVVKLFALKGIADTQCGFKIFQTKVAKDLFGKMKVYSLGDKEIRHAFTGAVDVELLFLARKMGYKIAEVPVAWKHFKTSRVHPIRDSVIMFFDVLKIKVNALLGRYD